MKLIETLEGKIWEDENGQCVISDNGGWLAGVYENKAVAKVALAQSTEESFGKLSRLQAEANARNGGTSGVITLNDLLPNAQAQR